MPKNKQFNNNKFTTPITWVGKQYHPVINIAKLQFAAFYSKCIFGALTLEVGNYVLVSNVDAAEPDSVDGCDVARIVHMYEMLNTDCTKMDPCRAIVEWYSRPSALPAKIINDENYAFDAREVVADARFSPDISIETIFNLCSVEHVSPQVNLKELQLLKPSTRCPTFFARYKLEKSSTRKWHLEPLLSIPGTTGSPRKRRSMYDRSNVPATEMPKTPKLKLTRTKSMENMATLTPHQKDRLVEDRWAVKIVDMKRNIDHVTEILSEIEISDNEVRSTPSRQAKLQKGRRSSMHVRLNANINAYASNSGTEDECLNYSIIKDDAVNEQQLKIKLRLSESQKNPETPRSLRKRLPSSSSSVSHEHVSPPKCRKSLLPLDGEIVSTPTGRTHRKSILKTPSTTALQHAGTPKRNIQLSNIVEECANGRRVSRVLKLSPKKPESDEMEEPKTPKRNSRSSLATATGSATKSTPKSANKMKLIRDGTIKPTIHSRDAPLANEMNELAIARERLHVSATPASLPCREKEYEEIYNFLEGKIFDGCGGCMYISGVPGTGKTATTTAVIRALKLLSKEEHIPKFEFIDINGMRLTEPRQAYVHIHRQLTGKTLAWEQAYNLLNKRFTTKAPRRTTTVLLVDELDILCNKRQDVVYNLLNWPTMPTAQLIVVTIANTMDLPERLLKGKISSRLGLTRLTFQPYNFRQLQEIVMARLVGMSSFNSDAVQLVARKVAAVSGDARRALDICRRATELADDQARKTDQPVTVSMTHVQQALTEMITSAKVRTIRSSSRMEQLFLQAVTAEVTRTGIEECNFLGVYAQYESLAAFSGVSVPNPGRAMAICARLTASRILICEGGSNDIYQKILLNISTDDVHFALQASKLM
ncbi:origin recognition complex subunit 1 [Anopheles maculipalpis]|uniref:origin recognition complex subunit 1 n=1 Tax=Anopheles maculipalpis TaxID=1496333 RepID=UPI002158A9C2|nr:origin recognition complex subunit 1 [Anopheles maculipalpis]